MSLHLARRPWRRPLSPLVAAAMFAAVASAQTNLVVPGGPPTYYDPFPELPCACPAWLLNGNNGTQPQLQFLGTIDNKPLSIRVYNQRAMQYVYATNGTYHSMNVLGGAEINKILPGAIGATIAGGGSDYFSSFDFPNEVDADFGTIGGGAGNLVQSLYGTIGGGGDNTVSADFGTIGGGGINIADGMYVTVGGGFANEAHKDYATIGGGYNCSTTATMTTIGGGFVNLAAADMSTIAGGHGNVTGGYESAIGGGHYNFTNGDHTTIAGGHDNDASGEGGAIGGGSFNQVTGKWASIPGGQENIAQGWFSFAAGRKAEANHQGSFVWADSTNNPFSSSTADEFSVRAAGGTRFYSNSTTTTGVFLSPNAGTWTTVSDRNAKKDIEPVDARAVLARLADIPISTWSYRGQDGVRHMGPMAQDFYAAFALGLGEKTIDTVDPDGVALAAIQGLNALVKEQQAEIAALERRLAALEQAPR